ncbi:MAG: CRISPR-associated protein Cas2 [Hyphomicrobiales bacterium]|nr:CRISPR-associated protein Cas2 [Hyphomicrobiales bacterium]
MALFSVTYDLIAEKDYDALIKRLNELDTVKVQLSQWLLSADNTAAEVKSHLAQYVDDDDKLMVIEFNKKPAYTKAIKGTNDWLDRFF